MLTLKTLSLIAILAPLIASIIAGIFGAKIGRRLSHSITIFGVFLAFLAALAIGDQIFLQHLAPLNMTLYTWAVGGNVNLPVGILVDRLSTSMILLVTFVSLLVHIYSIGYMRDDAGYQRFFSYMSLFTFAMLMLVLANNFLTLFFGWEGVGLVSYLLIGFWYTKPTAAYGSLKAFIANRVGDMGMILGIAGIFAYFGTLDYQTVFAQKAILTDQTLTIFSGHPWSVVTVISILLFIGAMGKSAQMPLHVWLPESMEGPTPISAMIHAATMVTAGVYLVCRFSPLFEMSQVALSVVLIIGATTCLFTGVLGVFQNDIKRVIAYSTLSQLGYMMAGAGASAFQAGMFHLFTHGCFKALLFLSAGSVIIGMHHEQDMRKMGGLWRLMPITYVTFLIGALALSAIPPFAGFYSKDTIIEAVGLSTIPGAGYAYVCVLAGAFVTALYTFRAFFMTFHGKDHIPLELRAHVQESPWVITFPLIILAIPSILLGFFLVSPLIYGNLLGSTVTALPQYNVLGQMSTDFHGPFLMMLQGFLSWPCALAVLGILVAAYFTLIAPQATVLLKKRFSWVYWVCIHKYGFDAFNQWALVQGTQVLAGCLFKILDAGLIDHWMVNGLGRLFHWASQQGRRLQTGHIYHYAFAMMLGVFVLLGWRLLL